MPVWTETLAAGVARRIIAQNPKRVSFSIRNDSGSAVFYGKHRGVAVSGYFKGTQIDANGGALEDEFYKGDVFAISASGVDITVIEDVLAVNATITPEDKQRVEG